MRKDREQQKKEVYKQLDLFKDTHPSEQTDSGTERSVGHGVELSSRLEKQRTLTTHALEAIVRYENLTRAYQQVKRNGGSSGVDGMSVSELREWLGEHMDDFRQSILNEQYQVDPVYQKDIRKPDGGIRMLGIPTVRDRMLQQAISQELMIYYDPGFSESSFGFRPGKSAHQAIEQSARYIRSGKEWVVDIDLEKFFDRINHDRLMQRLGKGIGDKRLLRLINSYLKAGLMAEGMVEQRTSGTPQGGPLSPLLSNIVLDELDKELEKRGHAFCRYADDCNIYVKSKKAGERVMASLIIFIERKLKLKVNRQKSGVRHCSEVKFLGYTLLSGGDIRVSDTSITRLKDKVRETTKRNRGVSFTQVIRELNQVIIGWTNYFSLANKWLHNFRNIDGWIRRKLRCYRLKQCGRRYTIFKFLRSFDIPINTSWNVVMYSQGWWAMSFKQAVSIAMGNLWFAQNGLHSLFLRMNRF
jgi:group II intron reverse transcriptase/maturase